MCSWSFFLNFSSPGYSVSRMKSQSTYIHIWSTTMYVPPSELGLPHPLSCKRVCPARNQSGGGGGGTAGEGAGSPNSDDWRKSLALCLLCTTIDLSLGLWVHYNALNTLCFTWTSLKAWMRVSPSSSPLHSHWCSELYTCVWQFTVQLAVQCTANCTLSVHLDMTIYSAVSCTPAFDNLQLLQFTQKICIPIVKQGTMLYNLYINLGFNINKGPPVFGAKI
jgi:hypothetical protein